MLLVEKNAAGILLLGRIHWEILILSLKFWCLPFSVFWKLVGKFTHMNEPSKLPV